MGALHARKYYRYKTQELLGILSDFLGNFSEEDDKIFENITGKINENGGAVSLKSDYDYAVA